ncbi:MAG: hypothetical protein QM778_14375 [Myxococcales bacterium]
MSLSGLWRTLCVLPLELRVFGRAQRVLGVRAVAAALFWLALGWSSPVFAEEAARYVLLADLGVGGGASSWRGDYLGCGSVLLGTRLFDWITLSAQLREGYANVDERLVTTLAFGAGIAPRIGERTRLTARISGVHQHEESVAVAREKPWLVPFGVGTGIRHRMGGELDVGARYQILELGKVKLSAGGEAFAFMSPDDRGPALYFGVLALIGAEVAL